MLGVAFYVVEVEFVAAGPCFAKLGEKVAFSNKQILTKPLQHSTQNQKRAAKLPFFNALRLEILVAIIKHRWLIAIKQAKRGFVDHRAVALQAHLADEVAVFVQRRVIREIFL